MYKKRYKKYSISGNQILCFMKLFAFNVIILLRLPPLVIFLWDIWWYYFEVIVFYYLGLIIHYYIFISEYVQASLEHVYLVKLLPVIRRRCSKGRVIFYLWNEYICADSQAYVSETGITLKYKPLDYCFWVIWWWIVWF